MQPMGRLMDWTLEDNIVDSLFFCTTLTGRRGGHTTFVQAGAYPICTSWSGNVQCRGRVGPKLFLGGSFQGVAGVGDENTSLVGLPAHSAFHWWSATAPHACCCCQMNWWDVVQQVQMGVSIWGAMCFHLMDRWALNGADVQAPWHSILEAVWLHCNEP